MERTMIITSLEEMCDLMCGGIEEDYDIEEQNINLINNKYSEEDKFNES